MPYLEKRKPEQNQTLKWKLIKISTPQVCTFLCDTKFNNKDYLKNAAK